MKKQDMGKTLNSLLADTEHNPKKVNSDKNQVTTKIGLKPGFTRSTLIVNEDHLNKLKTIAANDGVKLKEVIAAAFDKFIDLYEDKNGEVKPKQNGLRL